MASRLAYPVPRVRTTAQQLLQDLPKPPRAAGRRTSTSRRPRQSPSRTTPRARDDVPLRRSPGPGSGGAPRHARIWSSGVPSAAGGGASATATPARQRRNRKTSAPSCARVQKSSANRSGRRRADHRPRAGGRVPAAITRAVGAARGSWMSTLLQQ